MAGEPADLAAIHAAFADEVSYTASAGYRASIALVKSDVPAVAFQGPGDTLREISFEFPYALRPAGWPTGWEPGQGDTIREADGARWRVIDLTRRSDVKAWVLVVEEAS